MIKLAFKSGCTFLGMIISCCGRKWRCISRFRVSDSTSKTIKIRKRHVITNFTRQNKPLLNLRSHTRTPNNFRSFKNIKILFFFSRNVQFSLDFRTAFSVEDPSLKGTEVFVCQYSQIFSG